jgi:hypothetical protein
MLVAHPGECGDGERRGEPAEAWQAQHRAGPAIIQALSQEKRERKATGRRASTFWRRCKAELGVHINQLG